MSLFPRLTGRVPPRDRRRLRTTAWLLLVTAPPVLIWGTAVQATDADELCLPTADPCFVTRPIIATAGSVIDVGQRELQVLGNGSIAVRGGNLTLIGRRIVTGVGTLLRTSGTTRADAAGSLTISGAELLLTGDIDVRGSPAGEVDISGDVSLTMSGALRGRSEAPDESASTTTLSSDRVLLTGEIDLDGGRDDSGGDLTITGRDLTISAPIIAEGGDGGTVDISATESLVLTPAASISTRASTAAGDGGDISIDSDDRLEVHCDLSASGRDGGDDGGGDGAQITLSADSTVLVAAGAMVESLGGDPDGLGGDVDVSSLFGSVEIAGAVDAGSETRDGSGGSIDVSADTDIVISGTLRARGALGGGGDIAVDAEGLLTVAAGATIDASARRDATAGNITLDSLAEIDVAGEIIATTPDDASAGGTISMDACDVTIAGGGKVRSSGRNAINAIVAAGAIVVRGSMSSVPFGASNTLRYPDEGPTPDLGGASIQPAPVLIPDTAINPCVPLPPTPTPTPTETGTPIPTSTATNMPTVCVGDCDGDGMVSIAELVRAVNIALAREDVSKCLAVDANKDGEVGINELIQAVNAALAGCGVDPRGS